ncbi:MAG TPA: hypothetical protein VN654_16505 [Vicinamibacterales bacterium]|nr:hypothetical protein [Vicinamibacterales bacterium]
MNGTGWRKPGPGDADPRALSAPGARIRRHATAAHHIERARMSSPLAGLLVDRQRRQHHYRRSFGRHEQPVASARVVGPVSSIDCATGAVAITAPIGASPPVIAFATHSMSGSRSKCSHANRRPGPAEAARDFIGNGQRAVTAADVAHPLDDVVVWNLDAEVDADRLQTNAATSRRFQLRLDPAQRRRVERRGDLAAVQQQVLALAAVGRAMLNTASELPW